MTDIEAVQEIKVEKGSDISAIEQRLKKIASLATDSQAMAMVPTKFDTEVFGETWAAIELGTLLRRVPAASSIVWGVTPEHQFDLDRFATTAPGMVASFLGTKLFFADKKTRIGTDPAKEAIEYLRQGLLKGEVKGGIWTLVEFDDRRALTLTALSRNKRRIDQNVFANIVVEARTSLDIWKPRGDTTEADIAAMESISEFLRELFENAYIHGRLPGSTRQLRYMRFRKITDARATLLKRGGKTVPMLETHVHDSLRGKKSNGFFEVSVSDFGLGILDAFLASPSGRRRADEPRAELLGELIHDKLSSNSLDQNAGLGIPKALRAAKDIGALVSVRTGEFWWARSYQDGEEGFRLKPQRAGELAPVAGTHWQILWAPPY